AKSFPRRPPGKAGSPWPRSSARRRNRRWPWRTAARPHSAPWRTDPRPSCHPELPSFHGPGTCRAGPGDPRLGAAVSPTRTCRRRPLLPFPARNWALRPPLIALLHSPKTFVSSLRTFTYVFSAYINPDLSRRPAMSSPRHLTTLLLLL